MTLWIDAQLSPALAEWISASFAGLNAVAVRDLGLRDASDQAIHDAARRAGAVVMSKDRDFVDLLRRHGPPPQVIWITCGNSSNARMREVLLRALPSALDLVNRGEDLVEIGGL